MGQWVGRTEPHKWPPRSPDLCSLGLLFEGRSEVLCTTGKDKLPGPPAEPDHCRVIGSQKGYLKKDKQCVIFFKASINQNGECVKHTGQKGVFPHGAKPIEYPACMLHINIQFVPHRRQRSSIRKISRLRNICCLS